MKLVVFILAFILPAIIFAADPTAKFVFTTEQQTILPNEISGSLTIQSQNASGEKTNTTETIDLEFSSTSSTGEFLNSSGNPASTVMSKNTANRTFYYRDSTAGIYTLTVRAVGRESGQSWQVAQQIVVGEQEEESQQEGQSQSSSEDLGPVAPAASISKNEFSAKIIGGDRVAITGAQINFEGVLFGLENKPIESADFLWTFGDGTTARGRLASHSYNYPGKYIVYFNSAISGISVSASVAVNVISNGVKISEVKPGKGGWVEIANTTDFKIDISYWALSNGNEAFYFPKNTLIDAETYLIIPEEISGIEFFSSGSSYLLYPRGDVAGELAYSGALRPDESFHDADGVTKIGVESPGNGRFTARVSFARPEVKPQEGPSEAQAAVDEIEFSANNTQTAAVGASSFTGSSTFWFLSALVLGVLSAIGYLFVKRKSSL